MKKIDKIALSVSTATNLQEIERQVAAVETSNLPQEEKNKALKAHKRMVITTVAIVIGVFLLVGVACGIICKVVESEIRILWCLVAVVLGIVGLVILAICIRKLFPDWTHAYEKVDMGFDGLTEEEVNRLKPADDEKNVIKYWRRQSAKWAILYLLELAFTIFLIVKFRSIFTIIILVVITIIWYIKEDECQVEIHRIKSGYYKQGFGYICRKCKREVFINFSEAKRYESLPRNKSNIRMMYCPYCNNEVELYNFDLNVKAYKKHLEKVEKFRK